MKRLIFILPVVILFAAMIFVPVKAGYITEVYDWYFGRPTLETSTFRGDNAVKSGASFDMESGSSFEIGGVQVTSTAAELNKLTGVSAGTSAASKAVVLNSSRQVNFLGIVDRLYLKPIASQTDVNEGTLYAKTDHKLYYHNGTSFIDLTAAGSAVTDLDTAYNGGSAVTVDIDVIALTTPNNANNRVLDIIQNDTTNNPTALKVTNAGTGQLIDAEDFDVDSHGDVNVPKITTSGDMVCGGNLSVTGNHYIPSVVAAASGNTTLYLDGKGSGGVTLNNTGTGDVICAKNFVVNGNTTLGNAAADTITPTGKVNADIILDDDATDSPSLILRDAGEATCTVTKVNGANANTTITTSSAIAKVQILTGNLKVGTGTETVALNGEDAYITGTLEADGAARFDGAVAATSTLGVTGAFTASSTSTLQDNVTISTGKHLTIGTTQWDNGSDKIDGERIADDTIDRDSIDFTDVVLSLFTDDVGFLHSDGSVKWTNTLSSDNGHLTCTNGTVTAHTVTDGAFSVTSGAVTGATTIAASSTGTFGGTVQAPKYAFTNKELTVDCNTIILTSAQIKALNATPRTVVSAQGADTVIEFVKAVLILDQTNEAFTEDADNFVIEYKTSLVDVTNTIEMTGFIDQTADMVQCISAKDGVIVSAANCVNKGLQIYNLGDEIGGNGTGGSELIIKVYYIVHLAGLWMRKGP